VGKLCLGWGCRGVGVLPLLGSFFCPVCLQHIRKIFTLRNTHYLLPLSSCHLGKTGILYFEEHFISLFLFGIWERNDLCFDTEGLLNNDHEGFYVLYFIYFGDIKI
jgi:hypothetical protein